MNYRQMPRTGDNLSILGYGCMRFPRKAGGIDEARARAQILSAFEQGVNYFDTAYLYPGNEKALGNILSQTGIRDKVNIATKLPHIFVNTPEDIPALFQKQLGRLQTEYVDYYLVHNICTFADWARMKDMGIIEFVEAQKKRGSIRNFGFSFHGNYLTFKELVDDYPWDFCQIQFNYLDEHFQAGINGLEYAAEKGLGVIVMEPLRGGLLGAKIPPAARKVVERDSPEQSPAELGLRWVFSHPKATMALSGMNEEAHIAENIRIASEPGSYILTEQEQRTINEVKQFFRSRMKVLCTSCSYCMPCPYGVDIPTCFSYLNTKSLRGGLRPYYMYLQATEGIVNGNPTRASLCKDCKACIAKCPQHIDIPARLKDTVRELEKPWIRLPLRLVLKLMR